MKVCHISTLPPTQCGIADYAGMLMDHLAGVQSSTVEMVYGNHPAAGDKRQIRISHRSDYDCAVNWINESDIDVVSLQHEFGIYGGPCGEYVAPLVESIEKPVVVTLHTTSVTLPREWIDILVALGRQADAIVTLTESSRRNVLSRVPEANVNVVRHGIPNVDFRYPNAVPLREKFGDDFLFITPGHISAYKGIDRVALALGKLRERRSDFRWLIVGKEHPRVLAEAVQYRNRVLQLIDELNLRDHVIHVNEFLEPNAFLQYVMSANVGLALYSDLAQGSSGIVPTILGCGRPVISSPFEYARETMKHIPGLYVARSNEVDDIFQVIDGLIERQDELRDEMPSIYAATRPWIWSRIAGQYREIFERVRLDRAEAFAAKRQAMRLERDEARVEAERMRSERDQAQALFREYVEHRRQRRFWQKLQRSVKKRLARWHATPAPAPERHANTRATAATPKAAKSAVSTDLSRQIRHALDTMSGRCSYDKAMELCGLIAMHDVETILEVGVGDGQSLLSMAHALEHRGRGVVYGIEPWDSRVAVGKSTSSERDARRDAADPKSPKQEFMRYVSEHDLADRVRLIELSADDAFAVMSSPLFFGRVDLIHIGGSHSEVRAKRKILSWETLLRPSGILVLDDVRWPGVAKARNLIASRYDTVHKCDRGQESYGVYRKRSA